MFNGMDPLFQCLNRRDHDSLLAQDGPGVETFVDEMNGHTCLGDARIDRLLDRMQPWEGGKQRGVDVHDSVWESDEERAGDEVHVAREHDDLDPMLFKPCRHHPVALFA